jgi:hypothetical protein
LQDLTLAPLAGPLAACDRPVSGLASPFNTALSAEQWQTLQYIENLIARVQLRDRAAFADLYLATSAKLFGVCLRVLKDRALAEDVLQDVFVNDLEQG